MGRSRWCWLAYLMASPEFAVIDGAPAPSVEPFGLLEGLPVKVLEAAREWERHVVEVETGLPHGRCPAQRRERASTRRARRSRERDRAKAAELGVSLRTVKGAAGALRAAGAVGSGGSAGGAAERGDRPR